MNENKEAMGMTKELAETMVTAAEMVYSLGQKGNMNTEQCKACGSMLIRKQGRDKDGNLGQHIWFCLNKEGCGKKYKDVDGKPGEIHMFFVTADCPDAQCGGSAARWSYIDAGSGYYWKCPLCARYFAHDANGGEGGYGKPDASQSVPCPYPPEAGHEPNFQAT